MEILQILKANGIGINNMVDLRSNRRPVHRCRPWSGAPRRRNRHRRQLPRPRLPRPHPPRSG